MSPQEKAGLELYLGNYFECESLPSPISPHSHTLTFWEGNGQAVSISGGQAPLRGFRHFSG